VTGVTRPDLGQQTDTEVPEEPQRNESRMRRETSRGNGFWRLEMSFVR